MTNPRTATESSAEVAPGASETDDKVRAEPKTDAFVVGDDDSLRLPEDLAIRGWFPV